jgi:hypothetical protein
VRARETRGPTVKLDHLNPQTNHFSIRAKRGDDEDDDD